LWLGIAITLAVRTAMRGHSPLKTEGFFAGHCLHLQRAEVGDLSRQIKGIIRRGHPPLAFMSQAVIRFARQSHRQGTISNARPQVAVAAICRSGFWSLVLGGPW